MRKIAFFRAAAAPRAVLLAALLALFAVTPAAPVGAQVNIDAYRDYFLVGRFGEVCTMCEVVVLCEEGSEPPEAQEIPSEGDFTLYHLQTRTFWSQLSTIWEWFISNFTAADLAQRGHTRPVHVYSVSGGDWPARTVIEGRLILEPGVLEFGARRIDRVNRAWLRADTGEALGYCARLSLWEALESIEANAPEPENEP